MSKKKFNLIVDEGFNSDYLSFLKNVIHVGKITEMGSIDLDTPVPININKNTMLVFTGGHDVDPALYGEPVGEYTSCNKKRDILESTIYSCYRNFPKIGICRGAQFLTVMNGGGLIQHVNNHTTSHNCHYYIKEPLSNLKIIDEFHISSTHHQMMFPYNMPKDSYDILAWSKRFRSDTYLNGENKEITLPDNFLEPEIIYYNKTNSLAIQGHPEFKDTREKTLHIINNIINNYLINNK